MKVTLNTVNLQEMVARSIKGVSNNKLIPLTSLMCISLKNNKLTLITTDATNYLYIVNDKIVGDDFYVVLDANTFSKLVSKMTCENITLELADNVLKVKGNGNYSIELPLDENGQFIKYPDPVSKLSFDGKVSETVNRSTIQVILETIKPALAVTLDNPVFTGYYMGDKVIATDSFKIASMAVELFKEPKLISPELVNLLSVMNTEKIDVNVFDDSIVYSTPDCVVYGRFMEGIEEYSVDAINGLIDTEFERFCSIPKSALLQVLDRLALFVGTYDKNGVRLTFTNEGLQISSKSSSGVELIPYTASDNFADFTCTIDIEMFRQEVKAIQNDMIELYYGVEHAIKMTDGNIVIIVALMEDEMTE